MRLSQNPARSLQYRRWVLTGTVVVAGGLLLWWMRQYHEFQISNQPARTTLAPDVATSVLTTAYFIPRQGLSGPGLPGYTGPIYRNAAENTYIYTKDQMIQGGSY